MTGPFTVDQLDALDREVQIAADRRLAAELTVTGAGIPDASPSPEFPGVPKGTAFAGPPAGMSPYDLEPLFRREGQS